MKTYHKCVRLTQVPSGTTITETQVSKWFLGLLGRSYCHIVRQEDRTVESLKAFRQCAALNLRESFFTTTLESGELAGNENKFAYQKAYRKYSGLDEKLHVRIIQSALAVYNESMITKVRYLERDLKRMYLDGSNDKTLLRPDLPDLPRPINFERRDRHRERLIYRAKHQLAIIDTLRLDNAESV